MAAQPLLFTPAELRGVKIRNRIVISPMCTYSASDGFASDWHLVHLGKMAQGGAGLVFTEAAAVEMHGRITHGDVGIWSDEHLPGLARIVSFIKSQGSVAAIQLAQRRLPVRIWQAAHIKHEIGIGWYAMFVAERFDQQ